MSCALLDQLEEWAYNRGVLSAEQDYESGSAAIWDFETNILLGQPLVMVDKKTGLPLRPVGCLRDYFVDLISDTYNWHLRRIIAERGPPPNAQGVKERFQSLRPMINDHVPLQWTKLMAAPEDGDPIPTGVGPYVIVVEKSEKGTSLLVHLGSE